MISHMPKPKASIKSRVHRHNALGNIIVSPLVAVALIFGYQGYLTFVQPIVNHVVPALKDVGRKQTGAPGPEIVLEIYVVKGLEPHFMQREQLGYVLVDGTWRGARLLFLNNFSPDSTYPYGASGKADFYVHGQQSDDAWKSNLSEASGHTHVVTSINGVASDVVSGTYHSMTTYPFK